MRNRFIGQIITHVDSLISGKALAAGLTPVPAITRESLTTTLTCPSRVAQEAPELRVKWLVAWADRRPSISDWWVAEGHASEVQVSSRWLMDRG